MKLKCKEKKKLGRGDEKREEKERVTNEKVKERNNGRKIRKNERKKCLLSKVLRS